MQPDLNFTGYRPEFIEWLAENGHIWERFEREASRLWLRGRTHYSAKTIVEFLRHETALYEHGGEFKINNSVSADLARYYIQKYPERASFFEMRRLRRAA